MFNCTGYSQGYHWLVNSKVLTHQDNIDRGITLDNHIVDSATDLKIHLLSVPADPMNNGIKMQCQIYDSTAISSFTAVLLIQGK